MSAEPSDSRREETLYSYLGISSDPYFFWLTVAYFLLAALNITLLVLGYADASYLQLTFPQWWAIFTELSLFDTPQTLLGILLSLMLLALVNARLTVKAKRNRTLFFFISTFAAAIVANFAWYMSPYARTSTTHGASQIAYAADAILIVFSTCNLIYSYRLSDWKSRIVLLPQHEGLRKFWNMTNIGILASMIIVPTLVPPTLFQAGGNINTIDHAVAFAVAFIGATAYETLTVTREKSELRAKRKRGEMSKSGEELEL